MSVRKLLHNGIAVFSNLNTLLCRTFYWMPHVPKIVDTFGLKSLEIRSSAWNDIMHVKFVTELFFIVALYPCLSNDRSIRTPNRKCLTQSQ